MAISATKVSEIMLRAITLYRIYIVISSIDVYVMAKKLLRPLVDSLRKRLAQMLSSL
jgi:hypothetical protein